MKSTVGCLAMLALSLASCSSRAVSEPEGRSSQAVSVVGSVVPGYSHSISASRFKIGANPILEENTSQIRRWRGSLGAFAVDPGNGSACALLDATSPTGPYDLDEVAHGSNVKDYFVSAGIPVDQMGEIQATYQSGMMGGSTAKPEPTPFVLESVSSIIRRRISGVLVVESEAWAKMTVSGDVDMECVYWPPLDRSVVNAAVSWASSMADGPTHAAYVAKLPTGVRLDVGVVIHHSDMSVHAPATAFAAYDVVTGPPGTATRHFDQNGLEFRLPHEQAVAPAPGATRTRN